MSLWPLEARLSALFCRVLFCRCARRTVFPALFPASGDAGFHSRRDIHVFMWVPVQRARSAWTFCLELDEKLSTWSHLHYLCSRSGYRRTLTLPAVAHTFLERQFGHKHLRHYTCYQNVLTFEKLSVSFFWPMHTNWQVGRWCFICFRIKGRS